MGMFDYVHIEGITDKENDAMMPQVKCWGNNLKIYEMGSEVPDIDERSNYMVWLDDPKGFLCVDNNKIVAFIPVLPTFDQWGNYIGYPTGEQVEEA